MAHRTSAAVVAAAVGLLVAGCASAPESRPADLPPGKTAATDEQATDALNQFAAATATANAEFSAEPLAGMVSEPLLETTETSLALAEATGEEPVGPFLHAAVNAYSPRFTEYPTWFLSTSLIDNDPSRVSVQVMTREDPSTDWFVEHSVGLGAAVLPEISETGEVPEATDEQAARVDDVLQQVLGHLETGEDLEGLDLSGFGNYRDWVENSTIQQEQVTDPAVSCAVDDRVPVRSIGTVDGVLGVALLSCTITQQIRETIDATMSLGGELAELAPETGRRVEFVSSHPLVVSVSEDGTADAYSGGWRWARVTMHEQREQANNNDESSDE
ncbi:MAG TPA: hypothetical protein VFZ37_08460 [Jiangellaceae bacterium]